MAEIFRPVWIIHAQADPVWPCGVSTSFGENTTCCEETVIDNLVGSIVPEPGSTVIVATGFRLDAAISAVSLSYTASKQQASES